MEFTRTVRFCPDFQKTGGSKREKSNRLINKKLRENNWCEEISFHWKQWKAGIDWAFHAAIGRQRVAPTLLGIVYSSGLWGWEQPGTVGPFCNCDSEPCCTLTLPASASHVVTIGVPWFLNTVSQWQSFLLRNNFTWYFDSGRFVGKAGGGVSFT